MSKLEKLLERFLSNPKDFTYDELTTLLGYFGFEESNKGKTSGSRKKFVNKNTKAVINLHKPHPNNILKTYLIKDIKDKLTELGYIKE